MCRWRNILLASLIYVASLGLSLGFPGNTQIVVNVTSAIGVLLVSYFIPVINHFALIFNMCAHSPCPGARRALLSPDLTQCSAIWAFPEELAEGSARESWHMPLLAHAHSRWPPHSRCCWTRT